MYVAAPISGYVGVCSSAGASTDPRVVNANTLAAAGAALMKSRRSSFRSMFSPESMSLILQPNGASDNLGTVDIAKTSRRSRIPFGLRGDAIPFQPEDVAMKRRSFLGALGASATTAALGNDVLQAREPVSSAAKPMKITLLGTGTPAPSL